ncbi:Homeodomain-like domain-containing protein [Rhodopseudomonas thermotolerans]|uniref:Homeodomain-like domain-containing protein n=3 Tax=Nitrobacteraceae TaxID=41294 RepID=A0A336JMF7_9BRAD|nr:Homeodomain-like domain-containing protein [Rhodopseudomonas pentothenatexigens]REG03050.1 Homeodomain-like domain-containing protein [Rhodopseudomonas thermotolerans]SSW90897.1 Homeodomain-like domain-containing protein [Rhodopseudomonas pentothenatexigens]
MVGRRHPSEEIATKLAQANELAAKGKTQREISKALGVSVMTYHRWKKMPISSAGSTATGDTREDDAPQAESDDALKHLELENSRLRKLVTDLLLEKISLEEELRDRHAARQRRSEKTK